MTETPVLSLEDVHYSVTTKPILTGLSLQVSPGGSAAVLGRSGSGKSTLLTVALGLLRPGRGRVRINGTDLYALNRGARANFRSRHIGIVFQHAELLPELSALENVALPALLTGESRDDAAQRAARLLDRLEVPHLTLAADLSGGEQQRTALARAQINSPNLILADEPTGSLDTELRDAAADQLFELPAKTGCGLVVVTHDPEIAARAERIYVLYNGALALQQPAHSSRSAPGA